MECQLILEKVGKNTKKLDRNLIIEAYKFSKKAHKKEKRASGETYFVHPYQTAKIAAEMGLDETAVAAAFLHDVIEDTPCSKQELIEKFGIEVAKLVEGLTKLKKIKKQKRETYSALNIRRIIIFSTKDMRILLIKLADKLHNMRTLGYLPKSSQKRIAQECLEIYAPIAYRLGYYHIKAELDELAFKHLNFSEYTKIKQKLDLKKKEFKKNLSEIEQQLQNKLKENNISAKTSSRTKSIYSIYKKIQNKNLDFEDLKDIFAIRVITDTKEKCYEAIGIIHNNWTPLPNRFKDYIALPKNNLYQSLHTVVLIDGMPVEFQIRTEMMHAIAEEGLAAHWSYKGLDFGKNIDQQMKWIKEVIKLQKDPKTPKEFKESLKSDILSDLIYSFTPKGDIIELPSGAVVLDFAYSVHTELGHSCSGAKINGKFASIREEVHEGDIVEILTSKKIVPKRDWLKFVKTSKARSKIKQKLKGKFPAKKRAVSTNKSLINEDIGLEVKYAKCCMPIPGDEIIALIRKSGKAAIHKKDCEHVNINKAKKLTWRENFDTDVNILVFANDRIGLLLDVLHTISRKNTSVKKSKARTLKSGFSECTISLGPENPELIRDIILSLREVESVRRVEIKPNFDD